jgi:tRNA threonylcarbamoyladenosine biosynthesis protein TsaB
MAAQAKAETGAAIAIALHDARRDEIYLEIESQLPPSVLPFDDVVALLQKIANDKVALAGTAAPRVCDALANQFLLSSVRQPDALWVARLAMMADVTDGAPRPLYLRAPDAKLPASRT